MDFFQVNSLKSLKGKAALAVGTTRGAGRDIAAALSEAGATVNCTRSFFD